MSGEHPSSLSGVFRQPFAEQIAFFRQKLGNRVPTRRWTDLQGEAHDTAFMVAGAAEADLLTDLAAAVDKAISQGRGIEEFRRDFRSIVARNGWTGWAGEGSVKGEAWRTGVIYRTNAYTSYAAGRFAQLQAGDFPFWVYRHGGSREPRLQHLGWNGLVLPPDHEFWKSRYPPSDWGCSCYVVGARSEAGARRLGGDPDKQLRAGWNRIDPRTGLPIGIGKGWNYAPGSSVARTITAMAGKINRWDNRIATAYLEDLPPEHGDALSEAYRALPSTADDLVRYARRVFEKAEAANADRAELPRAQTLGMAPAYRVQELNEALGFEGITAKGYDFSLDREFTKHIFKRHGPSSGEQMPISPDDFAFLPPLVSDPDSISAGASEKGGLPRVVFRKSMRGAVYEAVFEIRGGKRTLSPKSFYIVRRER